MRVKAVVALSLLAVLAILIEDVCSARVEAAGNNLTRRQKIAARKAAKRQRQRNRARNRPGRPGGRTTPRPCPPIPMIDNGQASMLSASRAQAACSPGFVLEGTSVITCMNGFWVTMPRCVRATCPAPPFVPFANPGMVNGNMATYACLIGYQLSGGPATCNTATLMWMNLPSCTEIAAPSCGAPPTVSNAVSTLNGQQATYTCNTGYRIMGSTATITCFNSMWPSSGLPMCEFDPTVTPTTNVTCSNVPCGDMYIHRASMVADSFTVGSAVPYTCSTGYRIVGSNNNSNNTASIYCTGNGTWTLRPTCEPVVCGIPPTGVQTVSPIMTSCITYNCEFTYTCNVGFVFVGSLLSKCMADGQWSLPAPTCTQKMCLASVLPALANANFISTNYPTGAVVNYTCVANYRLAPTLVGSTATVQTVTCQVDGTYTALAFTCVYRDPTDCKDYFRRDNLFASTPIGTCVNVVIDPQGPGLNDPANPPAFAAQCCKSSATECCTEARVVSGGTLAPDGVTCASLTSTIFPGATFQANGAMCGQPTLTSYGLTNAQIMAMVASSCGSCEQKVTITCNPGSDEDFLILQCNGQRIGTGYGMTGLEGSALTGTDLIPIGYAGIGGQCDCATGTATPSAACLVGGCACTGPAPIPAGGAAVDMITKTITKERLNYVTAAQVGTFSAAQTWDQFNAAIGPIRCCSTF